MEIKQKLIPTSNKTCRPGIQMTPKYITVHTTDNTDKGANALDHANLQYNGNSRTASWHYTVDQSNIYQSIPDNEVAWHAGDGHGAGNLSSIAVEICVNSDGNFTKAKANAVWLINYLMDKHPIPLANVVAHKHWSGKECPREILPYWDSFIKQIKGSSTTVTAPTALYDNNANYHRPLSLKTPMMRGADIKRLQQRLQITADGVFGVMTKKAVTRWQSVHDGNGKVVTAGKGLEVDGVVGSKTWLALF